MIIFQILRKNKELVETSTLNFKNIVENSQISEKIEIISKFSEIFKIIEENPNNAHINTYTCNLSKTPEIVKGNFYFPLEKSVPCMHDFSEDDLFLKYLGEEKVDKVNQHYENNIKNQNDKFEDFLSDDLVTNVLMLQFAKSTLEVIKNKKYNNEDEKDGFMHTYYTLFRFSNRKKFTENTLRNRLIKIHDRFNDKIVKEENLFFHLSCKENEEKVFNNIVSTYKELFCQICLIFDCRIHSAKQVHNFENPNDLDILGYLNTYKLLLTHTEIKLNSTISDISLYFPKIVKSQLENLDLFLKKTKNLNISLKKIPIYDENVCSNFCWKNFLKINDNKKEELFYKFQNYKFNNVVDLYLEKMIKVYKFNPCLIYQNIVVFHDERGKNFMECTIVYIKIILSDLNNIVARSLRYFSLEKRAKKSSGKNRRNDLPKEARENIKENKNNSK